MLKDYIACLTYPTMWNTSGKGNLRMYKFLI